MPPDTSTKSAVERPLLPTLRRFLPDLWPADAPGMKLRVAGAMVLVVISKLVQVYGAPFALQGAVDGMAVDDPDSFGYRFAAEVETLY